MNSRPVMGLAPTNAKDSKAATAAKRKEVKTQTAKARWKPQITVGPFVNRQFFLPVSSQLFLLTSRRFVRPSAKLVPV
jgi:hypothetical protein